MLGIFLFYVIVIWQVWLLSRNKTVSLREVVHMFLYGAVAAFFGAYVLQSAAGWVIDPARLPFTAGPVIEEVLKILLLIFVLYRGGRGKSFAISDGLLLGVAAGAGFGFMENTLRVHELGLERVLGFFDHFTLAALPKVLISWLPREADPLVAPGLRTYYNVGHAWWTALVGSAAGFAYTLGRAKRWTLVVPLLALLWVILDHGLLNYVRSGPFGTLETPPAVLDWFMTAYGRGWGLLVVITAALAAQLILDELKMRKGLAGKTKVLLAGEKQRSFWGEIWLSITGLSQGWKAWLARLRFFRLRRQLAIASANGLETGEIEAAMEKAQQPAALPRLWRWREWNMKQRVYAVISAVVLVYVAWLLLFSGYLSPKPFRAVMGSPVLIVFGAAGVILIVWRLWSFYAHKEWRRLKVTVDDRLGRYAQPTLLHASGLLLVFTVLGLFGVGPFGQGSLFYGKDRVDGAGGSYGGGGSSNAAAGSGSGGWWSGVKSWFGSDQSEADKYGEWKQEQQQADEYDGSPSSGSGRRPPSSGAAGVQPR